MNVVHVTATAGVDGRLRLDIPTGSAGTTFDVAVVLQGSPAANAHQPAPDNSPGSLAGLFGCITDESFVAPPREMPRAVPSMDAN